jgi:hypothetical protein
MKKVYCSLRTRDKISYVYEAPDIKRNILSDAYNIFKTVYLRVRFISTFMVLGKILSCKLMYYDVQYVWTTLL